jgi:hypothetical protein
MIEITAATMYLHLLSGPVQEVQFLKEIFGQYSEGTQAAAASFRETMSEHPDALCSS